MPQDIFEAQLELHPESQLWPEYLKSRDLRKELFWAKLQRETAVGQKSPCLSATRWSSFSAVDTGCQTYHAFFPIAEELNMVSSPIHHPELYLDRLREKVTSDSPFIWIPAFATPRTYDLVIFAKPDARIVATDLCASPVLSLGLLYPEAVTKKRLIADKLNIFDAIGKMPANFFEAIVTDAFLTRFQNDEKLKVLQIFLQALKPGGSLFTTVRMPKTTETISGQDIEQPNHEAMAYPEKVIDAYQKLTAGFKNTDLPYPNSAELKRDAIKYTETMKSCHQLEEADLMVTAWMPQLGQLPGSGIGLVLSQIGFSRIDIKRSGTVFDITNREYLQICATK